MAKQKKPSIPPEIKSYIDEVAKKTAAAVSDAYKPLQQPQNAKAAFKNTEARLYALPVLKVKIKDDEEKIEELRTYGTPARSKSITRFSKSSTLNFFNITLFALVHFPSMQQALFVLLFS